MSDIVYEEAQVVEESPKSEAKAKKPKAKKAKNAPKAKADKPKAKAKAKGKAEKLAVKAPKAKAKPEPKVTKKAAKPEKVKPAVKTKAAPAPKAGGKRELKWPELKLVKRPKGMCPVSGCTDAVASQRALYCAPHREHAEKVATRKRIQALRAERRG